MKEDRINIIGAGAAGLTAAITLAQKGMKSRLIYLEESDSPLNVDDIKIPADPAEHEAETMKAGGYIIDPSAVKFFALTAPAFLHWLKDLGAGDVMAALSRERN
ncbi:MAG: FAD-binding protein, partial [Lachnospiraceae bacterium]|nr:FAD-binding protein [Lachnospiraceae bacterium]